MSSKKSKYRKQKINKPSKTLAKKASPPKQLPYPDFGKQEWINGSFFIVLAFLLYYATLSFGYILDDTIVILDNTFTKQGFAGIVDIFSTESFAGYFGEQKDLVQGARYRPLSIATFAVEYQFFGLNPAVSHFINVLLYGFTGVLLYAVLYKLNHKSEGHRFWNIAFVAALLYIAHPIHTEAVANIKGRDEIMAMMLSLGSMMAVLKWDQTQKIKYAGFTFLIFFLAMMAKENAITFCAIIPAALYVFRRKTIFQSLKLTLPVIAAAVLYLIIRYSVIGYLLNSDSVIQDLMNNPFAEMTNAERYATVSFTLWKYISLSIYPHPLAHDYYPYAIPKLNWTDLKAILPMALYIAMAIWSIIVVVKRKKNWFGLVFYLIALSIVSNIVVNVGTFMNERFIFMASAGICMLLAAFFTQWLSRQTFRFAPYLAIALTGLIIIGYSAKTIMRVPVWKDAMALNKSAVKVNPGSARANSFMSTALYEKYKDQPNSEEKKQQMLLAGYYAKQAIKIHPNYKNANLMRAGCAAELYKFDYDVPTLLAVFKEVMANRPDLDYLRQYMQYMNENQTQGTMTDWYYDVAYTMLFKEKRNIRWSIEFLKLAHDHDRQNPDILMALVEVYLAAGNSAEAEKYEQLLN
jgi:hypothetical protein